MKNDFLHQFKLILKFYTYISTNLFFLYAVLSTMNLFSEMKQNVTIRVLKKIIEKKNTIISKNF